MRTLPKKHSFKTTVGTGGVPSDSQTTVPMSTVPANIVNADYLPNSITILDGNDNYEIITYTGYTAPNLTGCTRGVDGTTPQTWEADATIYFAPIPKDVDDTNDAIELIDSTLNARMDGVVAGTFPDLYVSDAGGITVDIASGQFFNIATGALVDYAGAIGETLTDDSDNYIELTAAGVLNIETSAFTAGGTPLAKVTCASGDITANVDKRGIVSGGLFSYTPPTTAWSTLTYAATTDVDFDDAINYEITLTGNVTFTFSNPFEGMVKRIRIIQDATGSRTVTWPTALNPDGTEPDISTAGDSVDEILVEYDGSDYIISAGNLNIS